MQEKEPHVGKDDSSNDDGGGVNDKNNDDDGGEDNDDDVCDALPYGLSGPLETPAKTPPPPPPCHERPITRQTVIMTLLVVLVVGGYATWQCLVPFGAARATTTTTTTLPTTRNEDTDDEWGVLHVGRISPADWPQGNLSWEIQNTVCDGLGQENITTAVPPDLVRMESPPPRGGMVRRVAYHVSCTDDQVGNSLHELYAARVLVSAVGNVSFSLACRPSPPSYLQQMARYLQQVRRGVEDFGFSREDLPDLCRQCDVPYIGRGNTGFNIHHHLAEYAAAEIRSNLQDLAQREEETEGDDIAIHFRCGDAISFHLGPDGNSLVPFFVYSQVIQEYLDEEATHDQTKKEARPLQVSILTQSFDRDKVRSVDRDHVDRCRVVVNDFALFLQEELSGRSLEITIRAGDSIGATFARLIRARQVALCGPSTFCQFPVLASTARRGYVYQLNSGTMGRWMEHVPLAHLRSFDCPSSVVSLQEDTNDLSDEQVLAWLRGKPPQGNETPPPPTRSQTQPRTTKESNQL